MEGLLEREMNRTDISHLVPLHFLVGYEFHGTVRRPENWDITMKTCLVLQLLILLFIIVSSDGIFFVSPKKALSNIFDALRGTKDSKKSMTNVHHYHLHYYPAPVQVISVKPPKAPDSHKLEELHNEKLQSLGWYNEEYSFEDPKTIYPSKTPSLWQDTLKSPWLWDNELFESISTNKKEKAPELIVQVPLHQNIIFQTPPEEKEQPSFIESFIQKIRNIKKALFSSRMSDGKFEDRIDRMTANKNLEDYLTYLNSKVIKRH